MRYDLIFHVKEATASAVVLVDTLPSGLDPTTVSFIDGPIGTVNGNILTWVLGTVTPGDVKISFSVQVDPAAEGESVLTNQAQATSPSGQPVDAAASVKVKGDVQVSLGVYNDAGELVRSFPVIYMSNPIDAMDATGDGVLSELGESVTFTWGGGRVLGTWDGKGQAGQEVANGTYFIKVDSTDAYGTTSSVTKSLAVNRRVVTMTVQIYNEVGEVVRRLYVEKPMPSSDVHDVTLSTTVIHPGGDGQDGLSPTVGIVLSNGVAMTWDGTGENGTHVQDGTYYLQINIEGLPDGTLEISKTISVLGSRAQTGLTGVWPNVVKKGSTSPVLHARVLESGQRIQGVLYTIAGMRADTVQGMVGQNDIVWDLSRFQSGIYLVVIETREDGRLVDRTVRKVLVQK